MLEISDYWETVQKMFFIVQVGLQTRKMIIFILLN